MKLSRQYLLGLGSGLILSALIALLFNALSPESWNTGETKIAQQNSSIENSSKENSSEPASLSPQEDVAVAPEKAAPVQKSFVIPAGASAERIAQLLQTEGWIQNKEEFITQVKAQKLEKRFVAGSYELKAGLSVENIIHQLIR